MKAFNQTRSETLLLTENSLINAVFIYKVNGTATDISGGSFKWNILDKEGGSILDTLTIDYTSDGTDGSVTYSYTIAEAQVLLDAFDAGTGALPGAHEMFFSSDGTAASYKIWLDGPIKVKRSGS